MSLNVNNISIVHWFPHAEKHRCGYCKSSDGNISYGMWADTMTVTDYQNLIDRGWRRSGRYCYKPIMDEICCPQYTIRCDALNFKISKSHKKIIKKFNKFLNDGILSNSTKLNETESDNEDPIFVLKDRPNVDFDYKNLHSNLNESSTSNMDDTDYMPACSSSSCTSNVGETNNHMSLERASKKVKVIDKSENPLSTSVKKGLGADPNKVPCKKAKILRLERKQQKMAEKGLAFVKSSTNNKAKSLEQFLYDIPENCKHKLKMKLVSMNNGDDIFSDFDIEYEVYKKYQMTVHDDPPEKCTKKTFTRFLVNTPLKMKLEKMHMEHETFEISSKLFAKYQMFVHGDSESDCDLSEFITFLVESPLKTELWENSEHLGFGSFHQQYWIDDKLIAVGVIDILPKCVSSVYFFYDPDYRSLTLGTYGSLREIDFTRKLHQSTPNIKYYYMGFYIHSCPKMRYKGRLVPSDLLCPETYKWFPIVHCIPKLEIQNYSRLNNDPKDVDENNCTGNDIDQIKIFMFDGYVYFRSYKYRNAERRVYQNIGKLIGKKCLDTLLFVSSRH